MFHIIYSLDFFIIVNRYNRDLQKDLLMQKYFIY